MIDIKIGFDMARCYVQLAEHGMYTVAKCLSVSLSRSVLYFVETAKPVVEILSRLTAPKSFTIELTAVTKFKLDHQRPKWAVSTCAL